MQLDLKRDFDEIYSEIVNHVRKFRPKANNTLGHGSHVKAISFGYEYSQSGWFVIVFDTRPEAAPDGEWTNLIDGNEMERPHWVAALETLFEGPLTLKGHDGKIQKLPAESDLAEPLGEMILAAILKARTEGIFDSLPQAKGCELLLEHFDGNFGWPEYERRGEVNLARI